MAYKEKDTKKWTAQWFETNAKGEKKKRRKRGFENGASYGADESRSRNYRRIENFRSNEVGRANE